MGWRPKPKDPIFGADCAVFPVDKTPYRFIGFVSGIEYCHDIWPDGLNRPPTSFELTQNFFFPCEWDWGEGRWTAKLTLADPGNCIFNVTFDDVFYVFHGEEPGPAFGFDNLAPFCMPNLWYGTGGAGFVIARVNTTAPSLSKLCALAGVPDDIDTKCDVSPIDKDTGWVRFFREGLQIKSKMKFTLADIF